MTTNRLRMVPIIPSTAKIRSSRSFSRSSSLAWALQTYRLPGTMVTITEPHPKRAPRLQSGKAGMGERWTRGQSGGRKKTQGYSLWQRSRKFPISCLQHTLTNLHATRLFPLSPASEHWILITWVYFMKRRKPAFVLVCLWFDEIFLFQKFFALLLFLLCSLHSPFCFSPYFIFILLSTFFKGRWQDSSQQTWGAVQ